MNSVTAALANNVPIILAVLGIIGGIIAAKVIKPPTYKELVDENRALRKDRNDEEEKAQKAIDSVSSLRDEFEAFKTDRATEKAADRKKIGILGDGVAAMWSYIQVLIHDMERYGTPVPQPSDYVATTMEAARAVRAE